MILTIAFFILALAVIVLGLRLNKLEKKLK